MLTIRFNVAVDIGSADLPFIAVSFSPGVICGRHLLDVTEEGVAEVHTHGRIPVLPVTLHKGQIYGSLYNKPYYWGDNQQTAPAPITRTK